MRGVWSLHINFSYLFLVVFILRSPQTTDRRLTSCFIGHFLDQKWKKSSLFSELKASVQLATCLSPMSWTKDESDFFIDINFFCVQLLCTICDTYVEKLLFQLHLLCDILDLLRFASSAISTFASIADMVFFFFFNFFFFPPISPARHKVYQSWEFYGLLDHLSS